VERGEAKLYRYGAKPGRPATAENLRAFLYWLDNNIGDADGEGAGASMTLPTPGQRMAGESRRRELARSGQLTAMRTVREELGRIAPARPSTEAPGIGRIEVSAPAAPRSDAHGAGNSSPGPYLTPSTTPQADAERAFREGKRMLVSAPVCGYVPPPGCAGAAKYAEEYNRTLQELAKR
jgi:hypothetical protein